MNIRLLEVESNRERMKRAKTQTVSCNLQFAIIDGVETKLEYDRIELERSVEYMVRDCEINRILDAFRRHSIDLVGFYSDCEIVP